MTETLSQTEARRIALSAQGFGCRAHQSPSPLKAVTWANLSATVNRLHLLQMDSVNVLVRAHYMPLFSRHGAYDVTLLERAAYHPTSRKLFECWAHEASLVPLALHPLMRWRMNRALNGNSTYRSMGQLAHEEPAYLKKNLHFVEQNGPTAASDLPDAGKASGGWWGWSKGKLALETLFDQGLLTTSARPGFERIYDVTSRVIPTAILNLPTPDEPSSFRKLMSLAAQAYGIATQDDLRDYFRLPAAESRQALNELIEAGDLMEVSVEGWAKPAYRPKKLPQPKLNLSHSLLSPFDPLVWRRERAERLFNFHYRLEIYTPADKRRYGYYVLPFLLDDRLVGRCCLKADRKTNCLVVNTSHYEPGEKPDEVAPVLYDELTRLKNWLGLQTLTIASKGNLARALKSMMRRSQ